MAETSLGKMTSEMQSEKKKWPHEELNLPFSDYISDINAAALLDRGLRVDF